MNFQKMDMMREKMEDKKLMVFVELKSVIFEINIY